MYPRTIVRAASIKVTELTAKVTNIADRGKLQSTMSGHQEMTAYDDNSVFSDLTG